MSAGFSLEILGSRVRIGAADRTLLAGITRCFDSGALRPYAAAAELSVEVEARPSERQPGETLIWRTEPSCELDPQGVIDPCGPLDLVQCLLRWAIARSTEWHAFHAGAVSRRGRGVLVLGPPAAGKSTLCVALAQRGFSLLSDEVSALDRRLCRLEGAPRALVLRPDVLGPLGLRTAERGNRGVFAASDLGIERSAWARPIAVVRPRYSAGSSPARIRRVSAAEAVMSLFESSYSLTRWKVRGFDWILRAARQLPTYEVVYSDCHAAAASIEGQLDWVDSSAEREGSADACVGVAP